MAVNAIVTVDNQDPLDPATLGVTVVGDLVFLEIGEYHEDFNVRSFRQREGVGVNLNELRAAIAAAYVADHGAESAG